MQESLVPAHGTGQPWLGWVEFSPYLDPLSVPQPWQELPFTAPGSVLELLRVVAERGCRALEQSLSALRQHRGAGYLDS